MGLIKSIDDPILSNRLNFFFAGVEVELVIRFAVIARALNCNRLIDPDKMEKYCKDTREYYRSRYNDITLNVRSHIVSFKL